MLHLDLEDEVSLRRLEYGTDLRLANLGNDRLAIAIQSRAGASMLREQLNPGLYDAFLGLPVKIMEKYGVWPGKPNLLSFPLLVQKAGQAKAVEQPFHLTTTFYYSSRMDDAERASRVMDHNITQADWRYYNQLYNEAIKPDILIVGPIFISEGHPIMKSDALTIQQKRDIIELSMHAVLNASLPDPSVDFPIKQPVGMIIVGMPKRDKTSPTYAFLTGEAFEGTESQYPLPGVAFSLPSQGDVTFFAYKGVQMSPQLFDRMLTDPRLADYSHLIYETWQQHFSIAIASVDEATLNARIAEQERLTRQIQAVCP